MALRVHSDVGVRRSLWRPYGFVELSGGKARLFNFNGLASSAAASPETRRLVVETWFGEGAARFRVASIHPFQLKLVRKALSGVATVRFGFPGGG